MSSAARDKPEGGKDPVITCPRCGKDAVFGSSNPFRPFCSERCRLIDLGAWADERYRVPETAPRDGGMDDGNDAA